MSARVTEDDIKSGAQATLDISSALIKSAGQCMTLHGPDPNSHAIVAAGFVMAIDAITENIDPTFKRRVVAQLTRATP